MDPPDKPATMGAAASAIMDLPPPRHDETKTKLVAREPVEATEMRIATAESDEDVTLDPDTRELESPHAAPHAPFSSASKAAAVVSLPTSNVTTVEESQEPEANKHEVAVHDYSNEGSGNSADDENGDRELEESVEQRIEENIQPQPSAEPNLASHHPTEAHTQAPPAMELPPAQEGSFLQNGSKLPPNLPNLPILDSDNRELDAEGSLSSHEGGASEGGTDAGDLPDDLDDADTDDVDGDDMGHTKDNGDSADMDSASDALDSDSLDSPALSDELTASILEEEYTSSVQPSIAEPITPPLDDDRSYTGSDDNESFTGSDDSLTDDDPATLDHWASMDDLIDRAMAERPPPRAQGSRASAFASLTPWEFADADEGFTESEGLEGSEGSGVSDEEGEGGGEADAEAEAEAEAECESESGSEGEEGVTGTVGGSLDDAFAVAMGLRAEPAPAEALTFPSGSGSPGRAPDRSATEGQTEEESDFNGSSDGFYGDVFDKFVASTLPAVVGEDRAGEPKGSTSGSDNQSERNNVDSEEDTADDSTEDSAANCDYGIESGNIDGHSDPDATSIDNLVHSLISAASTQSAIGLQDAGGQFPIEDDLANAPLNVSVAVVDDDPASTDDGSYSDASSIVDGAGEPAADASVGADIDLDGLLDILAAMDGRHSASAQAARGAAHVPEEGAAKDTTAASDHEAGQVASATAPPSTASAIIPPSTNPSPSTKPTRWSPLASPDAISSRHSLLTLLEHTTTTLEHAKTAATSALTWAALLYAAFLWIDAVAPPTRALPVALQVALLMPAWAVVGGTAVYGACFVLRYPLVGVVVVAVLLGANVGREEKGPFLPRVGDVAWV